jgi:hypothetical protein
MPVKKKYPMTRENWILQMYDFGTKGVKDFDATAKKIIPPTKKLVHKTAYGMRLKKLDSTLDVEGYDKPRADIKYLQLKGKKVIRIGSDTINNNLKNFKKYILPQLNASFTAKELKDLDVYVEYPSRNLPNKFSGLSSGWESDNHKKFSTIDLSVKKDAPAAVHEFLHAIKFENGKITHDVHKDEAETEIETYVRLTPRARKQLPCTDGYYYFVKKNRCKAREEDAKIIESNCNIKNKQGLTNCIKKNLPQTHIGKIKIPKKYIPKN